MKIDYRKDKLLSEFSIKTMQERYMIEGEKSPQDAFARAAMAFADDKDHAQRLYNYVSNLWFMFASPLLSNGGTKRGLPISCFLNYVGDSREELAQHYEENVFLTSNGGGIGAYFGDIRSIGTGTSKGSRSDGVIPFMKVEDSQMLAFNQGMTRRGSSAVYLDISHPEISEFLDIRKPSGDTNRRCLNLHHGVNLSREFIDIIDKAANNPGFDDSWPLIDPHTKEVKDVVSAKALWIKILHNRIELGEPYLFFKDDANDALPIHLKEKGLVINHSNLCSEITLPTNSDRTAVCCLSSVNLEEYDQWSEDPNFIPDLIRMLDNVLEDFIEKAPPEMERAVKSAIAERSIGLGAMGFHAYLQRHNLPIESLASRVANRRLFMHIKTEAQKGNEILLKERGPCPDSVNSNNPVRLSHLMAIAPNATSSIICDNTSPSIEPWSTNVIIQKTLSGSHILKNPYLEYALQEIGMNTEEVWKDIAEHQGSVQHLDFLSREVKEVFKTFVEIDQRYLVELANDRGKFICQAQSLNLAFPAETSKEYLHAVHMKAAKSPNVKSLYYLRSAAVSRATDKKVTRHSYATEDECLACEG